MLNKLSTYAPFQIFAALAVFAVLSLQARSLSIPEYGALAIVMAAIEIARLVSSQWVNSIHIRFYAQAGNAERENIHDFSFNYTVMLSIPILCVLILLRLFYEPFISTSIVVVFSFFLSKVFFLYYQQVSRLSERRKQYQVATLIQAGGSVVFTWLVLQYSSTIDNALLAMTLSFLLALIVLKPRGRFSFRAIRKVEVKKYLNYGLPLMLTGLAAGLISRVDRFIIAEFMDAYAVGIYSAFSALLAGIIGLGFTLLATTLYPEVIKNSSDAVGLKRAHSQYLEILLMLTLPLLIGSCVFSTTITNILLGEGYEAESEMVFYFIALSAYMVNLKAHYFDHGLQFTLNTHLAPFISILGLLSSLILGVILIRCVGLVGAGISAFAASLLMAVLTWHLARKKSYIFVFSKSSMMIVASNIVLAGFVASVKAFASFDGMITELLVVSMLSAFLYFAIMLVVNPLEIRGMLLRICRPRI
jgi:polysaccharide biosynthesis protein VpsE